MNISDFRKSILHKYGSGSVDACSRTYHCLEDKLDGIPFMTQDELLKIILSVPAVKKVSDKFSVKAYNKNTIRALDVLGADVSRYYEELNVYNSFVSDYAKKYDRRNIIRVHKNYVVPLTNNFSLSELRKGEVNTIAFGEWYKNTYKNQKECLEIMCQVLDILKVNQKIIDAINANMENLTSNDDIYNKLREKFRSKIDRKLLHAYMEELDKIRAEKDIKDLSYDMCLKFCINISTSRCLIDLRIQILDVLGCPHIQKLTREKEKRDNTEKYIDDLFARMKSENAETGRKDIFHEINREIGGLEQIAELSVHEIITRYENVNSSKIIAYNIIKFLLKNNQKLLKKVNDSIDPKYRSIGLIQLFRTSVWRSELLDNIMEKHSKRIEATTAYYDSRYKKLEYTTVVVLNFIANHASTTYSKSINIDDPLRWFIHASTIEMVKKCLMELGASSNVDNTRVKNNVHVHHAKRHVGDAISTLNMIEILSCHKELGSLSQSEILASIPDKRIDADPNIRRTFTDDEIDRLFKVVEDDSVYTLLLTLFREIALRSGAICNLKYYDLIDKYDTPKHICRVLEKGKKIREFITSPNLKRKIVSYISYLTKNHNHEEIDKDIYIFSPNPKKPFPYSTFLARIKTIAAQADINGVHVHPHAFRHTLVGKLMSSGNSADVVSKFMGHASTDTTVKFYWVQTIEDLTNNLKNPFVAPLPSNAELVEETNEEIARLQTKLDSALKIIDVYNTHIIFAIESGISVNELNKKIHREIPDLVKLTKILQSLHDSSSFSTYTTD